MNARRQAAVRAALALALAIALLVPWLPGCASKKTAPDGSAPAKSYRSTY